MKRDEFLKIIETKNAPAAIGPYSQAIAVGDFILTSGQIAIDPHTGNLVSGGIEEQTIQVIKNLSAVLEEAGSKLDRVIKTTCFLQNIGDFAKFNAVYEKYFTEKPARSCVKVITSAESLGHDESLILLSGENDERQYLYPEELHDGFFRFSVGIEYAEDIIEDLRQTFEKVGLTK